ncbi:MULTISPECIES: tRNA1(Val) (adenine(37)-N6)-methyltransferase [unclassified Carboxylicivirga]|uniref:tRNA1(Val) (adenine(37)-N6)-methyltransferase n=1 Tax=Carboxylicivirga TaxID=1628153 RepID=UPI003D345F8A
MANNYFQFKQFTVHQDKAAMKVGTDGVLLGAWVNVLPCSTILDVGTGTGLIALMMAQRNDSALISAIDIDAKAVEQANDNCRQSPWGERIKVEHITLQSMEIPCDGGFDHIVCNPPFFINAYKANDASRNMARHTDHLSFDDLIQHAHRLTNDRGRLSVVLPYACKDDFTTRAHNYGFSLARFCAVRPTPAKGYVRCLMEFSKQPLPHQERTELVIEDKGRHGYSDDYIALTKAFYLAM